MRWLIVPALGVTCCQIADPKPAIAYSNQLSDNCLGCATEYPHYTFSHQQWQEVSDLDCTCSPSVPYQPPIYVPYAKLPVSSDITSELTTLHNIPNNVIVYLTNSAPPIDFLFNHTTLHSQLVAKEKLLVILTPAAPPDSPKSTGAPTVAGKFSPRERPPKKRRLGGVALPQNLRAATDDVAPTPRDETTSASGDDVTSASGDDAISASGDDATSLTSGEDTTTHSHQFSTDEVTTDEGSSKEESEGTSEETELSTDYIPGLIQADYIHDAWRTWLYSQGLDGTIMVNTWHSPDSSTSDIVAKISDQLKIAACGSVNSVNVRKPLDLTFPIWRNVSHLHIDVVFQREKVTGWNFMREGIEFFANDYGTMSKGVSASTGLVNVGVDGKCERLDMKVYDMQGWRKVSTRGEFTPNEADWKDSEKEGDSLPNWSEEWKERSDIVCEDVPKKSVDVVGCLARLYSADDVRPSEESMKIILLVAEDWSVSAGEESASSKRLDELLGRVGNVYLVPLWPSLKSWQCGGREVMRGLSGWSGLRTLGFRRRRGAGLDDLVAAVSKGWLPPFPARDFQEESGNIIIIEVWTLGKYVGYLMMLIIAAAAIAAALILVARYFLVSSEYRRFTSPDPPSGIQAPRN